MDEYLYDLAISFAGEDRKVAEQFATGLDASGYSVFYDKYEQDQLWGSDLTIELGKVYGSMARFCLMIVSEHYVRKMWTNHERQYALARLLQRGGSYVLPLKVDTSEIPGLPPTIAYVDLRNTSIEEVFQLLLRKLGAPGTIAGSSNKYSQQDRQYARQIIEACYRRSVFTKMDSEIQLDAMFDSLGACLNKVQSLQPMIIDQSLQYLAFEIIRYLDELERYRYQRLPPISPISNHLPAQVRSELDRIKIRLIQALLELRREASVPIQLPTSLRFDHFYSVHDANSQPS